MPHRYEEYPFQQIPEDTLTTWTAPAAGLVWYSTEPGGFFLSWPHVEAVYMFSDDPNVRGQQREAVKLSASESLARKFRTVFLGQQVSKGAHFPAKLWGG